MNNQDNQENEFEFGLNEDTQVSSGDTNFENDGTDDIKIIEITTPYSELRRLVKQEMKRVDEAIHEKVLEGNARAKAEARAFQRQLAERDALMKAADDARIAENDRKLRESELEAKRAKAHYLEVEKAERAKLFAKFEQKWREEEEKIFALAERERLFIEAARKEASRIASDDIDDGVDLFAKKYVNPYASFRGYEISIDDAALRRLKDGNSNN